ncbi:VCBS repeat-containing protein, partial [bacterium]|nr:VCBS repeat-containing protein [bacterium]
MDWNEDGLQDLLVGENAGTVRYFRNIGTVGNPSLTFDSYLQSGGINIDIGSYSQPWVNDWNEDGMKDLLVGSSDGFANLYINVGTNEQPRFNSEIHITYATGGQIDFGSRSGPIVIDLNGDGVKDLISGEYSGKIYYCQNNGTNDNPQLANMVALKTGTLDIDHGSTARIAIVDWDDDGVMDIASGGYDSRLRLYLQAETTEPAPTVVLTRLSGYSIPGGSYCDYNVLINNQTASSVTYDGWTDIQLPDDSFYGPIMLRELTTPAYGNVNH